MSTQWEALADRLEERFLRTPGAGRAASGRDRGLEASGAGIEDRTSEPIGRSGDPEHDDPWSDRAFGSCALEVFSQQFAHCIPYRALCERRGVTPASVTDWRDIPAVPATAFKYFDFVAVPPELAGEPPGAVFLTSGTTRGEGRRGRHVVQRTSLYRASFRAPFRHALLPDRPSIPIISLIPSPDAVPSSSLSWMAGMAVDAFGEGVEWLVDAAGNLREDAADVLGEARSEGSPVLVLGTALSFVHLFDALPDVEIPLPEGTRVMETGGFKGARRAITRSDLYSAISRRLGVPADRIVNEYGMTELLSQLYEPVLVEGRGAQGLHVAPPWLKVRVLDPTSLQEVAEGGEGILSFFDLANLASVSHILTEDVGVMEAGRLRLLGRVPDSEPRGCSRAMDDLMTAAES